MNKLVSSTDASHFAPDRSGLLRRIKGGALRTADYRRRLAEMRLRPPSQRAFLKRLLQRAALTGAIIEFPVLHHAAPNLVDHT